VPAYGETKAEPDVIITGNADTPVVIIEVEVTQKVALSREDRQKSTLRMNP
jgi:hypothetical protein